MKICTDLLNCIRRCFKLNWVALGRDFISFFWKLVGSSHLIFVVVVVVEDYGLLSTRSVVFYNGGLLAKFIHCLFFHVLLLSFPHLIEDFYFMYFFMFSCFCFCFCCYCCACCRCFEYTILFSVFLLYNNVHLSGVVLPSLLLDCTDFRHYIPYLLVYLVYIKIFYKFNIHK